MRFHLGEFEVVSLEPADIISLLKSHSSDGSFIHLVTFNSLMYLDALKNPEFKECLKSADILMAESSGIRWAARFLYNLDVKILAGVDLIEELFRASSVADPALSFYFLGARPGVAERAAGNVMARWPGVKICGVRDGFGGMADAGEAARAVARAGADVLVAGLGSPRQELFIRRHRAELGAGGLRLAVGVGGALDVFAGSLRRAPRPARALGLEWFWRALQEPRRLPRIARLIEFVAEVVKLKLKKPAL